MAANTLHPSVVVEGAGVASGSVGSPAIASSLSAAGEVKQSVDVSVDGDSDDEGTEAPKRPPTDVFKKFETLLRPLHARSTDLIMRSLVRFLLQSRSLMG